jgi:RNA polymerase sigma factor (TIGR02999 family)
MSLTVPRLAPILCAVSLSERENAVAEVTALLQKWNVDFQARSDALDALYDELKRQAGRQLRHERANHTLSATALVHESYLRMARQERVWQNREQFLAVASRMMRRILVDHARAHLSDKRAAVTVELSEADSLAESSRSASLLELDAALDELSCQDERAAQLIELRYFSGMTQGEAAAVLSVSPATAARDWQFARAWLYRRLRPQDSAAQR